MTFLTRFSLVVLRFAIGWHFLFEGIEKLESYFRGPAEGKPVWTSASYLRESTGPLRGFFRAPVGDPDRAALERLTLPDTQPPTLPPALEKDWKEYFDRFVAHYNVGGVKGPPGAAASEAVRPLAFSPISPFPSNLPSWQVLTPAKPLESPDKLQLVLAETALEHAKASALLWLLHGERLADRRFSKVEEKVPETTQQRIAKYREKVAQVREIEEFGLQPTGFGKDVWKQKLKDLKDEVRTLRSELLADLNQPMKEAMEFVTEKRLTKEQRARGPLPAASEPAWLFWVDQVTMWGVTAIGVCLILGLFTRTACVAGALFLLSVYAAMPALPWLPVSPRLEGHYFFVNKNLIEMLALLALATTYSGRWAGLDGLIHELNPWRSDLRPRRAVHPNGRPAPDRPLARVPASPPGAALSEPPPPSPVKEAPHGP
jgi:uncharacterized membrane protein YphA (DoxX/SURF4 family)